MWTLHYCDWKIWCLGGMTMWAVQLILLWVIKSFLLRSEEKYQPNRSVTKVRKHNNWEQSLVSTLLFASPEWISFAWSSLLYDIPFKYIVHCYLKHWVLFSWSSTLRVSSSHSLLCAQNTIIAFITSCNPSVFVTSDSHLLAAFWFQLLQMYSGFWLVYCMKPL